MNCLQNDGRSWVRMLKAWLIKVKVTRCALCMWFISMIHFVLFSIPLSLKKNDFFFSLWKGPLGYRLYLHLVSWHFHSTLVENNSNLNYFREDNISFMLLFLSGLFYRKWVGKVRLSCLSASDRIWSVYSLVNICHFIIRAIIRICHFLTQGYDTI